MNSQVSVSPTSSANDSKEVKETKQKIEEKPEQNKQDDEAVVVENGE